MLVHEAEWPVLFYINSFYFNVAIHCFGTKLKVEGLQKRLGLGVVSDQKTNVSVS